MNNRIPIEISPDVKMKVDLNFEQIISTLLNHVPIDHLVYLQKILVLYDSPDRKNEEALGLYYRKSFNQSAQIILCAKNIVKTTEDIPLIIKKLLLTPEYYIAKTLFHEIGHHYQYIRHGFKKEAQEVYAEKYARYMLNKVFWSSRGGRVLRPFKGAIRFVTLPIITLLKKHNKNSSSEK